LRSTCNQCALVQVLDDYAARLAAPRSSSRAVVPSPGATAPNDQPGAVGAE